MIREIEQRDLESCVSLAAKSYQKQMENVKLDWNDSCIERLREQIIDCVENSSGYIFEKNGQIAGYLLNGYSWMDNGVKHIYIPTCGCELDWEEKHRGFILHQLFQKQAEDMIKEGLSIHYGIKVYEWDIELRDELSFLQFGVECLDGLREIPEDSAFVASGNETYEKLSLEETKNRKAEILDLYHKLIAHLQKSPVFYPGKEFTDDVFWGYLLEDGTNVYAVKEGEQLIGMISTSVNDEDLFSVFAPIYDIGDVYVEESCRGRGIASKLLYFAEQDISKNGVNWLHVEHGTANLNARMYWERMFETIDYFMFRDILPTEG